MTKDGYKIVDFTQCKTCKHFDKPIKDGPCEECLDNPANLYSNVPVKYEKK